MRCEVDEALDTAAAIGLNVVRTTGYGDGDRWHALQPKPGAPADVHGGVTLCLVAWHAFLRVERMGGLRMSSSC